MFTTEDVIQIYQFLSANRIPAWLSGGWGIDALLGEQTRPHKDLDLLILLDDTLRLRRLLEGQGYQFKELWSENRFAVDSSGAQTATAFVLRDASGRELDLHALTLDERGWGIPAWEAEGFTLSAEELSGEGQVGGLAVRCLSPGGQVKCHTGYTLPETHQRDLAQLRQRFGAG